MDFDLLKYMSVRLQEEDQDGQKAGPVITISRLNGCPAKTIAKLLSEKLNEKLIAQAKSGVEWKFITKEILAESANQLQMSPKQIKYVFEYEKKGLIDDILSAHSSKYYKSDRKIRNTIGRVIRNMANEGHMIIVGRGGVSITRDIPRSLHINLEAPLEWRCVRIAEKLDISPEEAKKQIKDVDLKRKQFREYFEGKNTDYTWFDLTFNCMTLSIEEIVSIIVKAVEVRSLII